MNKKAVGIDIGGTKISLAVGTATGKVLSFRQIPTRTGRQAKTSLGEMVTELKALCRQTGLSLKNTAGIGVGIPGPVDSARGIVPRSPNLPGWQGIRLASYLSRRTGLPTVLANDANVAALGEKYFGAGKGCKNFIYMTISTGIGGGLILNEELYEGDRFVAGEIGHMSVVADGAPCKCGGRGCLEAYGSGTAIADYASTQLRQGRKSVLRKMNRPGEKLTGKMIGKAATRHDPLAMESYRRSAYYLGVGIGNLLNVLNPEKVILGGGVLRSAPKVFLESIRKNCRKQAWPEAYRKVRIVPTQLKNHVGNLGALALAFDRFGQ